MISWYSDGAASAVATKLMLDDGHLIRIIKTETNSEHPDNIRFQRDISIWFGQAIETLHNGKYFDVDDCIEKTNFLRGPKGARCTVELKKKVRFQLGELDKVHVFGYTADSRDSKRALSLTLSNPEYKLKFPLIERGYTKSRCIEILRNAGIEIPKMYSLGFPNNNCLGCLKAEGAEYWLLIKKNFPDIFKKRAEQERKYNYALCRINQKPVFLDELEEFLKTRHDVPGQLKLEMQPFDCDFLCQG